MSTFMGGSRTSIFDNHQLNMRAGGVGDDNNALCRKNSEETLCNIENQYDAIRLCATRVFDAVNSLLQNVHRELTLNEFLIYLGIDANKWNIIAFLLDVEAQPFNNVLLTQQLITLFGFEFNDSYTMNDYLAYHLEMVPRLSYHTTPLPTSLSLLRSQGTTIFGYVNEPKVHLTILSPMLILENSAQLSLLLNRIDTLFTRKIIKIFHEVKFIYSQYVRYSETLRLFCTQSTGVVPSMEMLQKNETITRLDELERFSKSNNMMDINRNQSNASVFDEQAFEELFEELGLITTTTKFDSTAETTKWKNQLIQRATESSVAIVTTPLNTPVSHDINQITETHHRASLEVQSSQDLIPSSADKEVSLSHGNIEEANSQRKFRARSLSASSSCSSCSSSSFSSSSSSSTAASSSSSESNMEPETEQAKPPEFPNHAEKSEVKNIPFISPDQSPSTTTADSSFEPSLLSPLSMTTEQPTQDKDGFCEAISKCVPNEELVDVTVALPDTLDKNTTPPNVDNETSDTVFGIMTELDINLVTDERPKVENTVPSISETFTDLPCCEAAVAVNDQAAPDDIAVQKTTRDFSSSEGRETLMEVRSDSVSRHEEIVTNNKLALPIEGKIRKPPSCTAKVALRRERKRSHRLFVENRLLMKRLLMDRRSLARLHNVVKRLEQLVTDNIVLKNPCKATNLSKRRSKVPVRSMSTDFIHSRNHCRCDGDGENEFTETRLAYNKIETERAILSIEEPATKFDSAVLTKKCETFEVKVDYAGNETMAQISTPVISSVEPKTRFGRLKRKPSIDEEERSSADSTSSAVAKTLPKELPTAVQSEGIVNTTSSPKRLRLERKRIGQNTNAMPNSNEELSPEEKELCEKDGGDICISLFRFTSLSAKMKHLIGTRFNKFRKLLDDIGFSEDDCEINGDTVRADVKARCDEIEVWFVMCRGVKSYGTGKARLLKNFDQNVQTIMELKSREKSAYVFDEIKRRLHDDTNWIVNNRTIVLHDANLGKGTRRDCEMLDRYLASILEGIVNRKSSNRDISK